MGEPVGWWVGYLDELVWATWVRWWVSGVGERSGWWVGYLGERSGWWVGSLGEGASVWVVGGLAWSLGGRVGSLGELGLSG